MICRLKEKWKPGRESFLPELGEPKQGEREEEGRGEAYFASLGRRGVGVKRHKLLPGEPN